MAVSPAIVTQYYTNVIRVAPTAAQVTYYSQAADAATLLTTLENQATVQVNPIIRLYQGAFNRVPDPAGLNGWVAQYINGPTGTGTATLNAIATGFVGAPEFASLYGANPIATVQSQTAMVANMYTNVLNRPAGQVEINLWLTEIARQQSLGYTNTQITTNVLLGFTNSPEFIQSSATAIQAFQSASAQNTETYAGSLWAQGAYTLTTSPDTATAQFFEAPQAYTPGGNDLVNTLQNEDVLTGNVSAGPTSLTGTLGNNNDNGYNVIAPTITNVDTINISFSATYNPQTLDFQDIAGTETANITRISNNLRQSFVNLDSDVATLGISNTSEQAKATITYLNNELAAANNSVTVNLSNVSLSNSQVEYDATGAALQIQATQARGSDLQNQIETYNVVTSGASSSIATFATGISSFDDLVVGERPVTVNVNAGANLSVGTLRWLGNRLETNKANSFQVGAGTVNALHQVGTNGLGFTDFSQISLVTYAGSADLTLANVGTWETEVDVDTDIDFTLNAATATGNLTADISNAAMSADASFIGGLGSDRFYAAGLDTISQGSVVPAAVEVDATILGGTGIQIDTLTVQSNAGTTETGINLQLGSANVDVLNAVQGIFTATDATWNIDLADGGFQFVTFNNQDTAQAMNNVLTNFNASTTDLSVRSTGLNGVGDPATTAQGAVGITFSQAAGLVGGTLDLNIGDVDDRSLSDAFSFRNYTSTVTLQDLGSQVTEVSSLNLVVDSAGENGTGALQLNVYNDDFETSTQLTTDAQIGATNTVNIGYQVGANSSDYAAAGAYPANGVTNALNSTVYAGGAYTGTQNVTFGSAFANQAVVKSHTIATGSGNNDTVDLSYMGTNTQRTAQGYAISSFLLNTMINMGGGTGDELILSASLADPRVVVNADITYDGYFANWSNVDVLTINNRNALGVSGGTLSQGATNSYVALDAYAQINNSGLNTINWNDVSGELAVGFRFTNALTINTDATATGGASGTRATKWTTLNSFSAADNVTNINAADGIATFAGAKGNYVQYTNTGASLANNVTLNYQGFTNAGQTLNSVIDGTNLVVQNGSLDIVTFGGNLGSAVSNTANLTVTADQGWVAANQTASFSFANIINSQGTNDNSVVTFDATNETDALGLTITGSSDGDAVTLGVNNVLTGSAGADTITSAGYSDTLVGGLGADTITYSGNAGVATNVVSIRGDLATAGGSADTINVLNMVSTETAAINAGAGNDIVTMGAEADTYTFADVATVAISSFGAGPTTYSTTSQMVLNVGSDSLSSYSTANDQFVLDQTVFGDALTATAGTLTASQFAIVANADALITNAGAGNMTNNGIVVVQAGTNASAQIYYVDAYNFDPSHAVTDGMYSVNNLIQSGAATLIGTVSNVTGLFAETEFNVVA